MVRRMLTSQLYGALITPNRVQNGVPVSVLMKIAAPMLPILTIFGLTPAMRPPAAEAVFDFFDSCCCCCSRAAAFS